MVISTDIQAWLNTKLMECYSQSLCKQQHEEPFLKDVKTDSSCYIYCCGRVHSLEQ